MKMKIFNSLFALVLVLGLGLAIIAQTAIPVQASDGSGTCTVLPNTVVAGSTGNTLTFTFTAAETMDGGAITITAPAGWSAPQGTAGTAGYTTCSSTLGITGKVLSTLDATTGWVDSGTYVTLSAEGTIKKEGTNSLKAVVAASATVGPPPDRWWYQYGSGQNWGSYTKVGFWIQSSIALNAGDFKFVIRENVNQAPTASMDIPALSANTWTHVTLTFPGAVSTRDSVQGYGIDMGVDRGACTIYLDEILIGPDNAGAISFSGQTTTVRILALASTQTITVTYGAGGGASGATAQPAGGTATFTTQSKRAADGTLVNITTSPTVTVTSPCTTYYRDDDNDNYGQTGDSLCLSAPSDPYDATVGGDCDDNNVAVNPGATEICNDTIDNDCDGDIDSADSECVCSNVQVQLAMVLDGSTSISPTNWNIMISGLAAAVRDGNCVPHDGTVELTVIQFGGNPSIRAQVEIEPVVITAVNYANVADGIAAIVQMTGYTPLACGITLAADTLAGSTCFNPSLKQAINIVTDGEPNSCCGTGVYTGTTCCPGTAGCDAARTSAVNARSYAIGLGIDEIDVEGIGISDTNRDWLKNNIIYPATGYSSPPESWPPSAPGWVRVVDGFEEFAATICEKFEIVVYGSITAHKFNDLNGDGDQDSGEDDFEGWTMTLYSGSDCSGTPLDSGETNADGNVVFTGLAAGTYSVEETLEDDWTNITALCQSVTIAAGQSATLDFGNRCIPPTVDVTKAGDLSCTVTSVLLTANTTGTTCIIDSYQWYEGDSSTGTKVGTNSDTYSTSSPGLYTCVVTCASGCMAEDSVSVNEDTSKPTVNITPDGGVLDCVTPFIILTANTGEKSCAVTSYQWYKDDVALNETSYTLTVNEAGNYTVEVACDNGCKAEDTVTVTKDEATPTVTVANVAICEGANATLTATVSGCTVNSYQWYKGTSSSGTLISGAIYETYSIPDASVADAGAYTCLVECKSGCKSEDYGTLTVNQEPTANFSGTPRNGCTPLTVQFTDLSTGATSRSWNFGDGGTSTLKNPSHTYTSAGTYTVSLTVTNACGSDTETKSNYIEAVVCGGGGGGGGGCPTSHYLTVDWEGHNTTKRLYSNDRLVVNLLGPSTNGMHNLLLERFTHAPIVGGRTHYLIIIRELEEIPPVPENTMVIMAFNVTPVGAFFDREIFLTLGFNQLPADALNATMAYYDDVNGIWVPLESESGGPNGVAELTLSAPINHFSIFGVLAELAPTPTPPPAHFVTSGLNIEPSVEKTAFVTKTGESVTITANVVNDGWQSGTYTVALKLNGQTVDTKTVTLGAGQSKPVSFTQSGLDYGQYEVEVAGLSDEFTVSRTIAWWLIIILIAALGLIIWGAVRIRRGRKAPKAAA